MWPFLGSPHHRHGYTIAQTTSGATEKKFISWQKIVQIGLPFVASSQLQSVAKERDALMLRVASLEAKAADATKAHDQAAGSLAAEWARRVAALQAAAAQAETDHNVQLEAAQSCARMFALNEQALGEQFEKVHAERDHWRAESRTLREEYAKIKHVLESSVKEMMRRMKDSGSEDDEDD